MGFWPSLPISIPASPGVPLLWDIVWWLFQAIVMVVLLIALRSIALRVDRIREGRVSRPAVVDQQSENKAPHIN